MPWIETEIEGSFTTKKGTPMVSFTAKRQDGRSWAAPQWLVSKGLGANIAHGLAVRIQVDGDQVKTVQRNKHQAGGVPLAAAGASPSHGMTTAGAQSASGTVLPYGFVPIDPACTVIDRPVWHDGSSGGELLSGEILCDLEALTPLLPGNQRYSVKKDGKDNGVVLAKDGIRGVLAGLGGQEPKAGKQIAEPLRLPDGRVLIAGTAIKGMIRQSLGALTSAPMERVAERHYTYRPNLDFNLHQVIERYVVRPALVTAAKNGGWEIEVFDNPQAALFVRDDVVSAVKAASNNGLLSGDVYGVEREEIYRPNRPPRKTNHLIPSKGSMTFSHRLASYKGGIDGQGLLAAAFNRDKDKEDLNGRYVCKRKKPKECRGPFTYDLALVPQKPGFPLEISVDLYQRYLRDQAKILADNEMGHLTGHPMEFDVKKVSGAVKDSKEFCPGQLVYVELTTNGNGKVTSSSKVVSCGHHFRYRWAYTSSVRRKNGNPRLCLTPHAEEIVPDSKATGSDVAPAKLTGARLLFGYVRNDENPIGKGVFERLAGRIAINHAVSVESDAEKLFVGSKEQEYCVPLRILGQPKASAWEFYLKQDKNKPLATYGDLPGVAGGDLSGRKFYRHWKSVSESHIRATTEEVLSDQAAAARYICKPGTKFRFAIRFARLRDWELGALLAVLQPELLAKEGESTEYAHKLGLGRPLGMGSVRIRRTDIRVRCERDVGFLDGPAKREVIDGALQSVKNRVAGPSLEKWLSALAVGDKALKYPVDQTKENGQFVDRIYAWHTEVRRQYSKLRREGEDAAKWAGLHAKIGKELPD